MEPRSYKKPLITILFLAIAAILVSLVIPRDEYYPPFADVISGDQNQRQEERSVDERSVTIQGEIVCLPHRDRSGPTTLECAYGLRGDNGFHYALNDDADEMVPPGYEVGERIELRGTVEPVNAENARIWQIYDVVAIIKVESFKKL